MKKYLLAPLLTLELLLGTLSATEEVVLASSFSKRAKASVVEEEPTCISRSKSIQLFLRSLQGPGVGYSQGYTTLEAFISTGDVWKPWIPFLDLQGSVFNNGKLAANIGLGLRYECSAVTLGINSYYDYRKTAHYHYNQVGVGLEAIGSFWSLTINGYLPVGRKESYFYNTTLTGDRTDPAFAFFQGNQIFITEKSTFGINAKKEFAFSGVDAMAFFRLFQKEFFALDFGLGPYYFAGSYNKFAAGGKASLTAWFTDYTSLVLSGSYDNLFRLKGEAGIEFSVPLGPKRVRRCPKGVNYNPASFYENKMGRGPSRNDVIVVDSIKKTLSLPVSGETTVAINPLTGEPYFVIFVNNLSSSLGTFESPYPTIQEALAVANPNDMIYVYEGSGAPYDIDNLTLIDDLTMVGSGIPDTIATQLGAIVIPAQTTGYPSLTNTAGATMLTFANRDTLGGFIVEVVNAGDIFVANTIDTLSFRNNLYAPTITTAINNFRVIDCTGSLSFQNNQFTMTASDGGSNGILLTDAGSGSSTLSIGSNSFTNHASDALNLDYSGSSSPTLNITSNAFTPPSTGSIEAITITTNGATLLQGVIGEANTFSNYGANLITLGWNGTGAQTLTISDNTLGSDPTNLSSYGVNLFSTADNASITVSGNTFLNQSQTSVNCIASTTAHLNFAIDNNTMTGAPLPNGNGIVINGKISSALSGSITNNRCYNYTNDGINLSVNDDATMIATVDKNTIFSEDSIQSSAGILANAFNTSAVSSSYTITNNSFTGHRGPSISSFANSNSLLSLNISNNFLTSKRDGILGYSIYGIQVGFQNSAVATNVTIANNTWVGPLTYPAGNTPQGLQLGLTDQSTGGSWTISGNTLTLPLTSYQANNSPTLISFNINSDATLSNLEFSNNTLSYPTSPYISDAPPQGLQINTNNQSVIAALNVLNNRVSFAPLNDPSVTNFYPNGISLSVTDTSSVGTTLIKQNRVTNMAGSGINIFCSSNALSATIDSNIITAYASGYQTSAIQVSANNTAVVSYDIINNYTQGHTNSAIASYPNGNATASYNIANNIVIAATNGIENSSPLAIQLSPNGNAVVANALITGNNCVGPATYKQSGQPQVIQINVGDNNLGNNPIISNVTISNNQVTLPITSYPTMSGTTGINVGAFATGVIENFTINSNTVSYPNSNYTTFTGPQGINVYSSDLASLVTGTISQNTVTFASPTDPSLQLGLSGIQLSASGYDTSFGTAMNPITVEQNTIIRPENNAITVNSGSNNSIYVNVSSNYVSMGTVLASCIGIVYNMGSDGGPPPSGELIGTITNNTINGNNGGFIGIVVPMNSSVDQHVTVENNTISNVHGNNPMIPGIGGGIAIVPIGSGNMSALIKNNALSGNTPGGAFGILSSNFGSSGDLCISFEDNHGIGSAPADGYVLYHDPLVGTGTFTYYRSNNAGTFSYFPDSSVVTEIFMPCP